MTEHGHSHAMPSNRKRLAIALGITTTILIDEVPNTSAEPVAGAQENRSVDLCAVPRIHWDEGAFVEFPGFFLGMPFSPVDIHPL